MPSLGGLDHTHTTSIPDRQTKVIIMFWVNYVFGYYPLHHTSILSLSFQLCQFGL